MVEKQTTMPDVKHSSSSSGALASQHLISKNPRGLSIHSEAPDICGWLYKWTNYLKGYQRRWFVVQNGLLSYYRNQEEMAHTCRGSIHLHSAVIHTEDSCNFVISNNATQTFHLKASSEVDKQRWITAIEIAKSRAIRHIEDSEEEDEGLNAQVNQNQQQVSVTSMLRVLGDKLDDLKTCFELIQRYHAPLQQSLVELEQLKSAQSISEEKIKAINERATLFRIANNAMINACEDYHRLLQEQSARWRKFLQHEQQRRLQLEEIVTELARQHSNLERAAKKAQNPASSIHSDEDEFYDAEDQVPEDFILTVSNKTHKRSGPTAGKDDLTGADGSVTLDNDVSSDTEAESEVPEEEPVVVAHCVKQQNKVHGDASHSSSHGPSSGDDHLDADKTKAEDEEDLAKLPIVATKGSSRRRTKIPYKPDYSLSLWSIMKTCIGKELTKIPMPVNFNEPLSTLQRLTEEYEYAELLDAAARCTDSTEQMAYVAAFTVSAYASTSNRTGKPFNPLLGETYECDRTDDLGWKCISEQVSHHPPMLAQHCEGQGWTVWQEFSMSSKFRGKYLQVIPLGVAHLQFEGSENHYTWRKVTTTVHNIIVGKLWVDHHGEMDIINHTTGDKCHLRFAPYSYFSRDTPRKVTGMVTDKNGTAHWVLHGTWDARMEVSKVVGSQGSVKGKPLIETSDSKVIWRRALPPPEYERMYNFTVLACQLNEPEEGVAPTDSRNRPDQRLMEEGKWDEANSVKLKLEEKQREARRHREAEAEKAAAEGRPYVGYEPTWFQKHKDPITGNPIHTFMGKYWECKSKQDWSACPDIYL